MFKDSILIALGIWLTLSSVVSAQSVDLLYEGDGSTPPFYQGGVPWSKEGFINLKAIPQGLGDPRNLSFKWSKNGTVLGNESGIGRDTLRIKDSIFSKPQLFKIEIVGASDETLALSFLTLTPRNVETWVYNQNPLYGIMFNKEVSQGYSTTEAEVSFVGYPIFFLTPNFSNPALIYNWGGASGNTSQNPSITYRIQNGSSGNANVSLTISNPNTLVQKASKSFLIQFNNQQ